MSWRKHLAKLGCSDDTLSTARATFTEEQQLPVKDLHLIRHICQCVSRRAAAYLASALHALWTLYNDSKGLSGSSAPTIAAGCHGSVILKYPGLRDRCQKYLDELIVQSGGIRGSVVLQPAPDATLLGAAVAAAYADIGDLSPRPELG